MSKLPDWLEEEEGPRGIKPRYGGVISCEDPDTGEEVGGPSLEPESILAGEVLRTVRPRNPRFHSSQEATAWYKIEARPPTGVDINTWYEWIRNRLWCAEKFGMSYQKLIKAIQNEDKFREWRRKYASGL